nr:immunoglobulin heavy chain junction region [Macaca mulatta]MOY21528.1 immunoglobulin heavy chain junction region [Macaca mulatta]MOY21880.1 immunoglobulin heavy chain junction region [Macaca mulatta]MOY23399.1 immunoglobulin heavy chain junction region [Macaca mulatta]MOY24112.1 immunoglobulin heavy chain junction region [Macaca mulatta]
CATSFGNSVFDSW